jgi:hypothetical protein
MKTTLICGFAIAALAQTTALCGQDLAKEAAASFPRATIRLEYSKPAQLRTLHNYAALRERYMGPPLQRLENSLSRLGVHEEDIQELLLGWEPGKEAVELYGFASGRFDEKGMSERAAASGLAPTPVGGHQAYCLEAGMAGTCVILLGHSLGAFGSFGVLNTIIDARAGQAPALNSDDRLAKLASEAARNESPLWGVAIGPAVSDWFKAWMPSQDSLQLDWSRAFSRVEALSYNVQAKDKVNLDVRLDCSTPEAAANLRQVLEGVRLFQQIAWRNQNPNQPNPFEALDVAAKDRRVELSLVAPYDAIGGVGVRTTP